MFFKFGNSVRNQRGSSSEHRFGKKSIFFRMFDASCIITKRQSCLHESLTKSRRLYLHYFSSIILGQQRVSFSKKALNNHRLSYRQTAGRGYFGKRENIEKTSKLKRTKQRPNYGPTELTTFRPFNKISSIFSGRSERKNEFLLSEMTLKK